MGIFRKGTKMYSINNMKCPKCHEGDLFETPTFSYRKPFDMPENCSHCGQSYLPEPGFYFGAMFVSYIITGWFCIFFAVFFHWILDWSLYTTFALLIAVCAILFVWIFRVSRAIWLNIVYKYDPARAGISPQE
jgi:uncharacterized protein (DUF983 family)